MVGYYLVGTQDKTTRNKPPPFSWLSEYFFYIGYISKANIEIYEIRLKFTVNIQCKLSC